MLNRDLLIDKLSQSKSISTQDPFKSFEIAEKVLVIAKKEKCNSLIAEAYFHMAYACRVMSKYSNALEYAFLAIQIFNAQKDQQGILKTSNIIGIIYFYYGDYTSAGNYYMKALDLLENIEQPLIKSSVLNNMGELHRLSEQWDKANEFYHQALEITIKNQFKNNASVIYSNIGEVFYQVNDFENSIKYLEEAYKLALDGSNYLAIGEIETKLGLVMYSINNYEKASDYYKSAFNRLNSVNNKFYLIDLLINMAMLEDVNEGHYLNYLNEALDIAISLDLHPKTSRIFLIMAEYYESKYEFKEALSYYKAFHMKEKEIEASSLATRLSIIAMEFKYNKEKKESQIMKELNSKFKKEIIKSHEELETIKLEYQQVLNENSIDELTQIYNRRGIRQLLAEKTQNIDNQQCAVYIIDIDYFKKYNDTLGHLQGDVCLKQIADHLRDLDYDDYFIGRFGGEEFLSYAKVKNLQEAEEIAEMIRKTVNDLALTYRVDSKLISITVSVGGKVSNCEDYDMNKLIRGADDALYLAKNLGRNRISVS